MGVVDLAQQVNPAKGQQAAAVLADHIAHIHQCDDKPGRFAVFQHQLDERGVGNQRKTARDPLGLSFREREVVGVAFGKGVIVHLADPFSPLIDLPL